MIDNERILGDLESVLNELGRITTGDNDCMLGAVAYTDMNSIPNTLDSCLLWIKLNIEGVYEELGGKLDELD